MSGEKMIVAFFMLWIFLRVDKRDVLWCWFDLDGFLVILIVVYPFLDVVFSFWHSPFRQLCTPHSPFRQLCTPLRQLCTPLSLLDRCVPLSPLLDSCVLLLPLLYICVPLLPLFDNCIYLLHLLDSFAPLLALFVGYGPLLDNSVPISDSCVLL